MRCLQEAFSRPEQLFLAVGILYVQHSRSMLLGFTRAKAKSRFELKNANSTGDCETLGGAQIASGWRPGKNIRQILGTGERLFWAAVVEYVGERAAPPIVLGSMLRVQVASPVRQLGNIADHARRTLHADGGHRWRLWRRLNGWSQRSGNQVASLHRACLFSARTGAAYRSTSSSEHAFEVRHPAAPSSIFHAHHGDSHLSPMSGVKT